MRATSCATVRRGCGDVPVPSSRPLTPSLSPRRGERGKWRGKIDVSSRGRARSRLPLSFPRSAQRTARGPSHRTFTDPRAYYRVVARVFSAFGRFLVKKKKWVVLLVLAAVVAGAAIIAAKGRDKKDIKDPAENTPF